MSNGPEIQTTRDDIWLVPLDPARDAVQSMGWIEPFEGEVLPRLEALNHRDYEMIRSVEEERLQIPVDNPQRIVWAIRQGRQTIGIAEVDLFEEYVDGPMLDVRIGERDKRRQGIGSAAVQAAVRHLKTLGHKRAYAAYHAGDEPLAAFWAKNGFTSARRFVHGYLDPNPEAYANDPSIIPWQSVVREL